MTKKEIRKNFRLSSLERDNFKCKVCEANGDLDVHHIINRDRIINGGYVKENGISLCKDCHLKAELFNIHKEEKYSPENLFVLINSNEELAIKKSKKLKL